MDAIMNELVNDDLEITDKQREYCLQVLEDTLQSDTSSFHNYFSSRPIPGSIVEDIAEIAAKITIIEREIKDLLVANKSNVMEDLLSHNGVEKLNLIHKELEQLWELNNGSKLNKNKNGKSDQDNKKSFLEDFLEQDEKAGDQDKDEQDEFHIALKKLRDRMSLNNDAATGSGSLAIVLENLKSITELMELPFLARTCIKTGHYQEAIMLYTHSKSLLVKFPGSNIVEDICTKVLNEISTTMLTGLVKLLSTNVTVNSLKKILKYLASIPPFDDKNNNSSLLQVFLSMRYIFIQGDIASYSLEIDPPNESLLEMMVKRKIEVLREYTYNSLNIFSTTFQVTTEPLSIPLLLDTQQVPKLEDLKLGEPNLEEPAQEEPAQEEPAQQKQAQEEQGQTEQTQTELHVKEQEPSTGEEVTKAEITEIGSHTPVIPEAHTDAETKDTEGPIKTKTISLTTATNHLMLQFVNECLEYLLKELTDAHLQNKLSNSVCLQLVYCSFRLRDLNPNYHNMFMNKLQQANLFMPDQISHAITKRSELASRYT